MVITSLENDRIKNYIKLKDRKYRKKSNTFIVEGMHLVEEAYKNNSIIEIIILEGEDIPFDNVNYIYVTKDIISKITNLDTPPRILALCKIPDNNNILGNRVLLLDNIQDPGNMGTIIRSSKAFNIDTIVVSKDSVDVYSPKVLRATEGIIFHINIVIDDLENAINDLKNNDIPVYGTNVNNGINVCDIKDRSKYAIVMGNEGNGVGTDIQSMCDSNIYIDMNNNVESLNVAVATSIILYELNK